MAEWDDWANMRPYRRYMYYWPDGTGPFCAGKAAPGWCKGSANPDRDRYTPSSDRECASTSDLMEYSGPPSDTWCSWNRKAGGAGAVAELQVRLQRVGYSLTADGIFGSITEARVKSFQTSRALTPDGVVGKGTWDALRAYR